jgi:hypothetical protein
MKLYKIIAGPRKEYMGIYLHGCAPYKTYTPANRDDFIFMRSCGYHGCAHSGWMLSDYKIEEVIL